MKKINWWNAYKLERKVADIIARQEYSGWQFDKDGAEKKVVFLRNRMEEIYEEVRPHFRQILVRKYKNPVNKPFLKSGEYNKNVLAWFPDDPYIVSGPFSRLDWEEPNLKSDKQVKELLLELGWKPTEWNYKKDKAGRKIYDENRLPIKTSPKLTEDSYDSLTSGVGPSVALYLKMKHRKSSLEGLIKNVDSEGLIHAAANPLGTPTGRMRHSVVVNIPKAKDHVFFGKEMRECFIHRPGRVLVGHDAAGLEARVLAHCLNDPELTHIILNEDFHEYFWGPLKDFINSRDQAKNVEYALSRRI